jgi:hypothetical protein
VSKYLNARGLILVELYSKVIEACIDKPLDPLSTAPYRPTVSTSDMGPALHELAHELKLHEKDVLAALQELKGYGLVSESTSEGNDPDTYELVNIFHYKLTEEGKSEASQLKRTILQFNSFHKFLT